MSTENKEVVKKSASEMSAYGVYADAGFENQTRDDIVIPFITVLQDLSPQVKKGTVEGAKVGMLFNTVTEQLVDPKKGILFVPAYTEHVYIEWIPRKRGGGFVASYKMDDPIVTKAKEESEEFGKLSVTSDEGGTNDLVETFNVYGSIIDEEGDPESMAVISFTSSKIKTYKRWNTSLRMFTLKTDGGRKVRPPLFAHQVRITTVKEVKGDDEYYNFCLSPANDNITDSLLAPDSPALQSALDIAEMVKSGEAVAAHDTVNVSFDEGAVIVPNF